MDLNSSLREFFHDAVSAAMRNQGVEASELAEFYLVNLLSEYSRATIDDVPLAVKLSAAATALPAERARALRDIGDQSLYVSGFFSDSLSHSLVDVDYYISIGGTAYGQLARMGGGRRLDPVFDELAGKFPRLVDVLAEVSHESALTSDKGVVELYERWLRTGSAWIERKLRARGLMPRRSEVQ